MKPILKDLMGREWVDISDETGILSDKTKFSKEHREILHVWLYSTIAFWYHMGYDFVRIEIIPPYPGVNIHTADDTASKKGDLKRNWADLIDGPIGSWDDFENYKWPVITDDDFYIHRYICDNLPDGMGFMSCHVCGVYEHMVRSFGYEKLSHIQYQFQKRTKRLYWRLLERSIKYIKCKV